MAELTGIPHIAFGVVSEDTADVWNDVTSPWDDQGYSWDVSSYNPTVLKLLMANYGGTATPAGTTGKLFVADVGGTYDGANYAAFVERTGLAVIGQRRDGAPNVDITRNKFVRAVYPKVEVVSGTGNLEVRVGAQQYVDGSIIWEGPYEFNPATMDKVNCTVNGKLIAVRFGTPVGSNLLWKLRGYALDVEVGANW